MEPAPSPHSSPVRIVPALPSSKSAASTSTPSPTDSPSPGSPPWKQTNRVDTAARRSSNVYHPWSAVWTKKTAKVFEIIALVIAVIVVLVVFSPPIIFHFVEITHPVADDTSSSPSNCSVIAGSWGRVTTKTCTTVSYNGSVCRELLSTWRRCALGQTAGSGVQVNASRMLEENERSASTLLTLLRQITRDDSQCLENVLPFLCQFAFPLCDPATGDLLLPSQEECQRISNHVCMTEWQLAQRFPTIALLLPDCSSLPSVPTGSGSGNGAVPSDPNVTVNLNCRHDFLMVDSTCQPRCDRWEQSPHGTTVLVTVVELFAAVLGLCVGILVIISSIIRWKNMLKFPAVFLVYMTIGYCIVAAFVIIPAGNIGLFYCTNESLQVSLNSTTPFCTTAGVVLHYFIVNISLWWFFHVCSMFYKVTFPFLAKRWEEHNKYFHLASLILGILLPVPAVVVTLTTDGYITNRFPPVLCGPRNTDLWYYSTMFVINLLLIIGVSLLVITFWKVHKYQGIFRIKVHKSHWRISTPEKKLLFILSYYVIFGVITLVYFSVSTAEQDRFLKAVREYFYCEAPGNMPSCSRATFEQFTYPILAAVSYLLMGFIPVIIFIFTVNWGLARKKMGQICLLCCSCCSCYKSDVSEAHSGPSVDV